VPVQVTDGPVPKEQGWIAMHIQPAEVPQGSQIRGMPAGKTKTQEGGYESMTNDTIEVRDPAGLPDPDPEIDHYELTLAELKHLNSTLYCGILPDCETCCAIKEKIVSWETYFGDHLPSESHV
jgi:hypothetical protein